MTTSASVTPTYPRPDPDVQFSAAVRVSGLLAVYLLAHWELWHRIGSPTFGWRPTDLASIALNYYPDGFDFFYPQVFWGGGGGRMWRWNSPSSRS